MPHTPTHRIGQPNTGKVNNTQSDKVLEQPLVKPGGVRGRSTVRREKPSREGRLTSREAFKLEGVSAIPETFPEKAKPVTAVVDRNIAGGLRTLTTPRPVEARKRKAGTGTLNGKEFTSELERPSNVTDIGQFQAIDPRTGEFTTLTKLSRVGISPRQLKARREQPGRRAGGLGQLAGALFEQRSRAGGIAARRKTKTARTKATTERIKALSSTLKATELLGDEEGETKIADFRSNLRTQISDLVAGSASGGQDAVLTDATRFLKAGFSREEVESIMGRLGSR